MNYRPLGKSGLKVSPLCLGTMMFGGPTNQRDSIRIIHRALDAGVNFVDTADIYQEGATERVVGKALRGHRARVILATKVRGAMGSGPNDVGASRAHILAAVEASLRRLATDYIDLYYLHRPDYTTPLEESLRALDDLVRAGKVRYIACSNFYAWQIMEGLAISERQSLEKFVCVQPLYNIVNRDIEVELLPFCQTHGLGVVCYSPLARGVLSGKYRVNVPPPRGSRAARGDKRIHETEWRKESIIAAGKLEPLAKAHGKTLPQFSLAWILANPIVTAAIVGPRTLGQWTDNLGCLECKITGADEIAVDRLVPIGEHTGSGFRDPFSPVLGRPKR